MNCAICEASMAEGAKFCGSCGASVFGEENKEAMVHKTCASCGSAFLIDAEVGAGYCDKCGMGPEGKKSFYSTWGSGK